MSTQPKSQPLLTLDRFLPARELVDTRDNFSAIVLAGGHLWLGGDEGTRIDRMTPDGAGDFGRRRRVDLSTMVCYDSPAEGRLVEDQPEQVRLDIFKLA